MNFNYNLAKLSKLTSQRPTSQIVSLKTSPVYYLKYDDFLILEIITVLNHKMITIFKNISK